ncbi:hypothetical protein [Paenibacillus campi]|uniref:hypothetical protein n=1 Tax=Paenibacillus campi TaxID=3106031 RepID=UPI002AFDF187|nr:hypothetical protein [Paenibacillus sp. SGZ-1014]
MNMIYEAAGTVYAASAQSHIAHRFMLHTPVPSLQLEFSYEPKLLDDETMAQQLITRAMNRYGYTQQHAGDWRKYAPLQNLLTLSLDDPERHRGQAHRMDPVQRHVLTASEASPGFWPGDHPAGLWTVTLSLHAVVTEQCHYKLRIMGGDVK